MTPLAPPPLLAALVGRLLPPAAREAVLGDLWERYRSPLRFLGEGLAVLPFLIVSQVRRRSSWPILCLQAFILFACLRGFAADESVPPRWAHAALPTALAFLALAWRDAYRATDEDPGLRSAAGEAAAVLLGIAIAQALTIALVMAGLVGGGWLLRAAELLFAACAVPVLCVLRAGFALAAPAPTTGDMIVGYDRFRAAMCRRNRLEAGAMLATVLLGAIVVNRGPTPVPAVVPLTLAAFLGLAGWLAVRGAAPPCGDRAPPALRSLFRDELLRQHRLRSLLVWCWLAPLFAGLLLHFLLRGKAEAAPIRAAIGLLLVVLLAACIHALNMERGALVRRRIAALDAGAPIG